MAGYITAGVLSCVIMLSSQFRAADLDDILKGHLEILGNRDSVEALSSVESYFEVSYMGLPARAVVLMEFPDRYYDRLVTPYGTHELGFDGVTGWMTDANGHTRRASAEELKSTMNELYFQSFDYVLHKCLPGSTLYVGDTTIGTTTCHHLKLYPSNGDSLSLLLNTKTGRIDYKVDIADGIVLVTAFGDFCTVSGILLPFHAETHSLNGRYEFASQIDSVFLNRDIPDSIFAMPGKRVDYRFDDDADSTVVPMYHEQQGLIIHASVNGQGPFRFLLDTGSSTTVIARRLADELEVDAAGTLPSRGIGGYGDIDVGRIDSIRIGDLAWRLNHISIFDFVSIGEGGLRGLDGILGYDLFVRFTMQLDFARMNLVIYNPESATFKPRGEAVPISLFRGVPIIEGVLDGIPTRLGFDLGAVSTLIMQRDSRWFLEKGERLMTLGTPTSLQGMGGAVTAVSVPVGVFEFGPVSIGKLRAFISTDETAEPYPDYIEGLLGIESLLRYVLYIDYAKRRIYFAESE